MIIINPPACVGRSVASVFPPELLCQTDVFSFQYSVYPCVQKAPRARACEILKCQSVPI